MEKEIICDNCNQPMKLLDRLTNHKTKSGSSYRRRRFKCDLCDITKLVIADGNYSDYRDTSLAKLAVKKMYKDQEKNNE